MDGPAKEHPGLILLSLFPPPQFRLKRCGLGHRIYLVEEHGSMHNLSLPESTLLQAVTNTQVSREGRARLAGTLWSVARARSCLPLLGPCPQVIDGFFVKRTADIKESAAYLALLTRGLERLYQVSSYTYLVLVPYLGPIPTQGEVSETPVPQAGPVRPRIGQGLAGGFS